jgi:hypothetical protein
MSSRNAQVVIEPRRNSVVASGAGAQADAVVRGAAVGVRFGAAQPVPSAMSTTAQAERMARAVGVAEACTSLTCGLAVASDAEAQA